MGFELQESNRPDVAVLATAGNSEAIPTTSLPAKTAWANATESRTAPRTLANDDPKFLAAATAVFRENAVAFEHLAK